MAFKQLNVPWKAGAEIEVLNENQIKLKHKGRSMNTARLRFLN